MPHPDPESYTSSPSLPKDYTLTPQQFLSSRPQIQHLMASALVFRKQADTPPQALLIRRSPSDSYPLKWESPGGGVDTHTDASLVATAVRELWEETGLRVRSVLCAVGMVSSEESGSEAFTAEILAGLGISPEEENAQLDVDGHLVTFDDSGERWGKATFLVLVHEGEEVVLRPEEHDDWAWVSEAELRSGRLKDSRPLHTVSGGFIRTLFDGFRLWGGMLESSR